MIFRAATVAPNALTLSMDETHTPDELMRRTKRARRLANATFLLAVCSLAGLIGVVYTDIDPVWKAAIGSACPFCVAAFVAANARREHWLRCWLRSLE